MRSLFALAVVLAACTPVPVVPHETGDAAVTPWTIDAGADDPGFVVEPTCAAAAKTLHALGCAEGDDERRFGISCTMARGSGTFDFREACIASSKSVDSVRTCCGTGEVCSHIKCKPR
jgi:hypothetical protein